MTTIALRDWILAVDGRCTWNHVYTVSEPKIRRGEGYVFAVSGVIAS